eukprot:gene800-9050_t
MTKEEETPRGKPKKSFTHSEIFRSNPGESEIHFSDSFGTPVLLSSPMVREGSSMLFENSSGTSLSESTNPSPIRFLEAKKLGFIVNPKANKGKCGQIFKEEIIPLVTKHKEKIVEIVYTKCKYDGIRLAQKLLDSNHDIIVSVGGDGTFYEILNGAMTHEQKSQCIFGLLPLGSSNNYAKSLGFDIKDMNYQYMIEVLFYSYCVPVDVGKIIFTSLEDKNIKLESYFINSSSFGHSPSINNNEEAESIESQKTNIIKYRIDSDESKNSITSYFTTIQIGKYFANELDISPKSSIQDGFFDVYIAGDLRKFDFKKFKKEKIQLIKCSSFSVTPQIDANVLIECDGELVGKLPAKWSILQRDINVIVPKNKEDL